MKRTSLLLLAALLLSSCNSKLEYNIWEFTHEKHTYISFDDMKGNFCVIHSPDCKCGKDTLIIESGKDTLSTENRKEVQE